MRRWICLSLSALCLIGLCYCSTLWDAISGQSLYRLNANVSKVLQETLIDLADEQGADFSAFAIGETRLSGIPGLDTVRQYECLHYHPNALGVLLIKGVPLTQDQLDRGERVVMLSEGAAMLLAPDLDCIGWTIQLNAVPYRIVGVYRQYEPLGFMTRTDEASMITPILKWDVTRRLYVWFQPLKESLFAYQQLSKEIKQAEIELDAGSFQSADLDMARRMNQQGIRFWVGAMLSIFCWRVLGRMSGMRCVLRDIVQRTFRRYYSIRASLRLVWPFVKYIAPSLAVLLVWGGYMMYCMNRLIISAARVPSQILDPGAWFTKQAEYVLSHNLTERMPVYAYLLNEHLQWISVVLGIVSICLLWAGRKTREKRIGDER